MADIRDFTKIDGGKTEHQEAVEALRKALPEMITMWEVKAQLTMNYFNALIHEGFSKEEALEIVKFMSMGDL